MTRHITKKAAKQLKTRKVKFASLGDNDSTTTVVGEYDEVVHPKHYNHLPNGIECWDVTEHFPGNISNGIKYLWRVGLKPGQDSVKDLKKVIQYTQRQIDLLEGKTKSMK
jgi:hypothetical protein